MFCISFFFEQLTEQTLENTLIFFFFFEFQHGSAFVLEVKQLLQHKSDVDIGMLVTSKVREMIEEFDNENKIIAQRHRSMTAVTSNSILLQWLVGKFVRTLPGGIQILSKILIVAIFIRF